ncbi:MAG: prepilin-type N-terminal cleavage/methylation domain-containing protein [Planctomycetota bacterium]
MSKRIRHGFTLIELLVVISIIALLVGILLPVLTSARASGRSAACSSNLRQIGIAHAAYVVDYDGWGTPYFYSVGLSGFPWYRTLWDGNYFPAQEDGGAGAGASVEESSIIKCPEIFQYEASTMAHRWKYNGSYLGNGRLVGKAQVQHGTFNYIGSIRVESLNTPSDLLHFVDNNADQQNSIQSSLFLNNIVNDEIIDFRHVGSANWLAYDGHVDTVRLEEAVADPISPTVSAWTQRHTFRTYY